MKSAILLRWSTALLLSLALHSPSIAAQDVSPLNAKATDGLTVYGQPFYGNLGKEAPLILLFHQGGSSGRGEYTDIASWLNQSGYRAIAWDLRSGGSLHGVENRTVSGLETDTKPTYCEAYVDLQAALDYVISQGIAKQVIAWGSSYSGSLVFRLAAENRDQVSAVMAFSPASGGPMVDCRARNWSNDVDVPVIVFRPQSEMERESSIEQQEILTSSGARFEVIENGEHGSSMLLDSRTGHDMSNARQLVSEWLEQRK